MIQIIKSVLRNILRRFVLLDSDEFRLTAVDLVRKTPALRSPWSPLNMYLAWRHGEIERQGLRFYDGHPLVGDIFEGFYGKIDRIALATSFLQGSLCIPGDVAEFGVHRGHTAASIDRVLAQDAPDKKLYLFDSYEGMPEISHHLDSAWEPGDLASPVEDVQELFADSGRVKIVKGFFSETLSQYPDLRFSFCHVDADLYTSVKECIEYILPRLSPGGIIVFDDYGFRAAAGAKAAIIECLGNLGTNLIPLPTGQAVYLSQHNVEALTRSASTSASQTEG